MKILLVNESGNFQPGIIALAKALSIRHRVCIVAPQKRYAGSGHSMTINRPLRSKQYFVLNKVKMYQVTGTPCDCVTLALNKLLKSKPDLIVSGICEHNNRGETIYSSGVVSAAIEGTIQGIPSMSVSAKVEQADDEKYFMPSASNFAKRLEYFMKNMPPHTTLNINYPAKISAKRIICTHLTDGIIENKYLHEVDPQGNTYYWLKSPLMGFGLESLDQKGDLYWLKKNYITVTPLKLDLTETAALESLQNAGIKL